MIAPEMGERRMKRGHIICLLFMEYPRRFMLMLIVMDTDKGMVRMSLGTRLEEELVISKLEGRKELDYTMANWSVA